VSDEIMWPRHRTTPGSGAAHRFSRHTMFRDTVQNLGGVTPLYETVGGFDVPLRAMSDHRSIQPRVYVWVTSWYWTGRVR